MIIEDTELEGVKLIKPTIYEDFRGTNFESYNKTKYRDEIPFDEFVVDSISTHDSMCFVVYMVTIAQQN